MTMAAHDQSSTAADDPNVTVVQALAERWSCRGYRPEPVPRATIEQIVESAQRTPSWCNTQPWQVAIFSGDAIDDLRASFATDQRITPDSDFPPGYTGVYQERRREVGLQLYDAVGVERGDRQASALQMLRNFDFFDAPHVAIVSAPASLGPYGYVDCGLYVQSFLLAAHAHGVATIAQAAVAMKSELLHERLGWGEDRQVVCGISFGWPDPEHPSNTFRAHRAPVSDAVTFLD